MKNSEKEAANEELEKVTGGIDLDSLKDVFPRKHKKLINDDQKPSDHGLIDLKEATDVEISHCGFDGHVENRDDPTGFNK